MLHFLYEISFLEHKVLLYSSWFSIYESGTVLEIYGRNAQMNAKAPGELWNYERAFRKGTKNMFYFWIYIIALDYSDHTRNMSFLSLFAPIIPVDFSLLQACPTCAPCHSNTVLINQQSIKTVVSEYGLLLLCICFKFLCYFNNLEVLLFSI